MKFLKVLLLIIVLLIGGWIILCLIGPSKFDTSRSAEINANAVKVWPIVSDLNNWSQWSPWEKQDPDMKMEISSPSYGVGAKMTWTSDVVGSGSLRITESDEGKLLTTALSFEGFDNESISKFVFDDNDGKTRLTWTMEGGEMPFLFRGFMVFMNPIEAINKDYDNGLAEIRKIAESMPDSEPETDDDAEADMSFEVEEEATE